MTKNVLVIEDDPEISGLLRLHLDGEGYHVEMATDGGKGLAQAETGQVDLLILDLMLPTLDGMEICRRLRRKGVEYPILMLTAKSEEVDKVLGLEVGADDYLTKPFGIRELVARVRALLRRVEREEAQPQPELLDYPGMRIEVPLRKVLVDGEAVELTAKEFDLLLFFARQPGVPFNRDQLLDRVWGYSYFGYTHTVNTHINRLRAKIEADPANPRFIRTVWGVGYRFAELAELGRLV